MAAGPVSVLVVDDQAPFRSAARLVVRATRGFEVIDMAPGMTLEALQARTDAKLHMPA